MAAQAGCCLPPNELLAGLARRDHRGGHTSEEHLKSLDGVCAFFKLHAHASVDNGDGVFLTLGQPEACHKVPLETEEHSGWLVHTTRQLL